ncbi:ATP-dependent nuclease [Burkholderia lata]|uniref:ATP-dependent nuclease n=1 Tax=Burkholderia lata (strain ATCC 17760 / DSM 23089 / LMG 22485 / NCIMB 9086 / R18194 / 383) TaxID=482957 RepID=UPI00145464C0|nr:AAA family ATPase [Burkholderia lata]VWM17666.1 DNA replication and repair protein RecF [Burkholderia lata]
MFICGVTIENFRSFLDKVEVNFSPGMNLILGENNAGKSAILEAFALNEVQYNPHLSVKTKPFEDVAVSDVVRIGFQFIIKKDEVFRFLGKSIVFPIPEHVTSPQDFSNYLRSISEIRFGIASSISSNGRWLSFSFFMDDVELSTPLDPNTYVMTYSCDEAKGLYAGGVVRRRVVDVEGSDWAPQIRCAIQRVYKFRAERMNITRSGHGANTALAPNSSNLAECLNLLQSRNPHLFDEYVQHVRHIFPSVHRVQVVPLSSVELEIRALLTPSENRRPDLSIPLSQAGTGIGQVLSILYVAMLHSAPITIAIDEPNSFLHPKAVRTLLQILNALPTKHQYIVTTHSPEVIRAAAPKSVMVVRNEDGISKIDALNPDNFEHIKVGLASIGARLSDLYGADRILWVEGETEELTFPDIARRVGGFDVIGVTMLKVNATGDFESPKKIRPKMVFDTYCQLSTAGALLPPAIGFVFDSEGRAKADMDSLAKESGNKVQFLPRLCFENYILHAGAIAAALSETCGTEIDPNSVASWIQKHGNDKAYLTPCVELEDGEDLLMNADWLTRVHAPKLLKELFSDLTNELLDHPEEYRKTTHSVAISNWLVNAEPQFLQPVADVLRTFFARS